MSYRDSPLSTLLNTNYLNLIAGSISILGSSQSSPEIYGAVGDGLTDDTTALQSCITNNRNIILGYNKTYRITSTLNIPSNTKIDLNSSTILTNDGSNITTFLNVDGTFVSSASAIFRAQSVNNVSISNGKIAQCIGGIHSNYANNLFVDNVEIYWTGDSFYSTNCEKNYISNLYLHDNRRTCLNLHTNSQCLYENIKIYNPSVWGIYLNSMDNCIFDNINMDYDTTYETFYGGATGGVMNVAFLNKYYSPYSWAYGYGQKTIEHTAYTYSVTNSNLRNCNWYMNGISTKIVHWRDTEFNHCKFGLYWTLPNTNGSGYIESVGMKFYSCIIGGLSMNTYTADGAKWDVQFNDCELSGNISNFNMNSGTGIFTDCRIDLNNCRIISDNGVWEFGQFDGYVNFNNCDFYPNSTIPQYCYKFTFNGLLLPTSMKFIINNSRFHNSNSSYYPLILQNIQVLAYSPPIYINNCQFINCNNKAIQNTQCNIYCSNVNFENNLNTNSSGTFKYDSCIYKDLGVENNPLLTSTNWFEVASGVSLTSGIFNLTARSPTFNEQILNINGSTLTEERNNYNATNSPRILCAETITSGTVQIDYVQGHSRQSISLVANDEIYQTFIPSGNFYLYNIQTLESTLGSFDYAIYTGIGTGGTLLTSGTSTGGNQLIVPNMNIPIYLTSGQTYTLWLKANASATIKYVGGWYPAVHLYINGVQQVNADWALYFYGKTTIDALNVYVKGIANTEVITTNYDSLTFPFVDRGSSTLPTNVTSAYYDSSNMIAELINDNLKISNTTVSTSISTGALVISGGLGVSNNIYTSGIINVINTTASTSVSTGSVILSGGLGVSDGIYCNGLRAALRICIDGTEVATSTSTGALKVAGGAGINDLFIANTLNSTSTSTGSAIISGGVGIGGNLYVGGTINGTYSISDLPSLNITGTTASTSTSTGALVVAGGAGFAKKSYMTDLRIDNGGGLTNYTSGALQVLGGASIQDGFSSVDFAKFYDSVNIYGTWSTTSTDTGALQVVGGVGIAGGLTTAGIVRSQNTTASTSTSTGSVLVSGGVGIAGNLNVGGDLNVSGSISYAGSSLITSQNYTPTTSGAFVGTMNGKLYKIGNLITLTFSNLFASATSTDYLVISGAQVMPSTYRPSSDLVFIVSTVDNNVWTKGIMTISTAGEVYFYKVDINTRNFTTGVVVGVSGTSASWII